MSKESIRARLKRFLIADGTFHKQVAIIPDDLYQEAKEVAKRTDNIVGIPSSDEWNICLDSRIVLITKEIALIRLAQYQQIRRIVS